MIWHDWPQFTRLDALRREMDRLWDAMATGDPRWALARSAAQPALNVWDAGDALCVEAEAPGVRREDLEILVVGSELTVKGRRRPHQGEPSYHRQERRVGEFTRVLSLTCEVDADKVEATLENGVLTIRLPKAASARPRQIAVKAR
jgi:HSP20 family protein